MSLTSPYPLSKGTGTCAATGVVIAPGSAYVAALVEMPLSQSDRPTGTVLARVDYSVEAWNAGSRPAPPTRLFGFWRTVYQPVAKEKKHLLDDASLLEVFESLSGIDHATDQKQVKFRYLLTLLLIRRRLLRVVATKKSENGHIMQVLRRGEPDAVPIEVFDPGLDDLSIADAMESLAQLVNVDEQTEQPTTIAQTQS